MGDADPTESRTTELGAPGLEIFIAVLSILSIVNIVLFYAVDDDALDRVLLTMNVVLSIVFIGDVLHRLATAPSRRQYLVDQMGWADVLASLPFMQLKVLRLLRLLRVVRVVHADGLGTIARRLVRDRAGSALLSMVLMGLFVLEFGSFSILALEKDAAGAHIVTASDALWYVVVTMSTVGYGDTFPVTDAGRIMGALVIVIGVGIFGTFTGYLANLFLRSRTEEAPPGTGPHHAGATGSGAPIGSVAELRDLLERQQAVIAALESRLAAGPD